MIDHTQLQPGDVLILRDGTRRIFGNNTTCLIFAAEPEQFPRTWNFAGQCVNGRIDWDIVAVERDGKRIMWEGSKPEGVYGPVCLPQQEALMNALQDMVKQEAPAADEAAYILAGILSTYGVNTSAPPDFCLEPARAILAAIRANPEKFVPLNIRYSDTEQQLRAEVERLKAESSMRLKGYNELEAKLAEAERDLHQSKVECSALFAENKAVLYAIENTRAKLAITQNDRAEQQRVAMESEREAEAAKSNVQTMAAMKDKEITDLRASLAEAEERAEREEKTRINHYNRSEEYRIESIDEREKKENAISAYRDLATQRDQLRAEVERLKADIVGAKNLHPMDVARLAQERDAANRERVAKHGLLVTAQSFLDNLSAEVIKAEEDRDRLAGLLREVSDSGYVKAKTTGDATGMQERIDDALAEGGGT